MLPTMRTCMIIMTETCRIAGLEKGHFVRDDLVL
jgi:hypothetical protein